MHEAKMDSGIKRNRQIHIYNLIFQPTPLIISRSSTQQISKDIGDMNDI